MKPTGQYTGPIIVQLTWSNLKDQRITTVSAIFHIHAGNSFLISHPKKQLKTVIRPLFTTYMNKLDFLFFICLKWLDYNLTLPVIVHLCDVFSCAKKLENIELCVLFRVFYYFSVIFLTSAKMLMVFTFSGKQYKKRRYSLKMKIMGEQPLNLLPKIARINFFCVCFSLTFFSTRKIYK